MIYGKRGKHSLWLILALAFLLRVIGVHFGLPDLYHQDEPMMVNHALGMAAAKSLHPGYFVIPGFVMYFLLSLYGLIYGAGFLLGFFPSAEAYALYFLRDPSLFYLVGRLFIGVLFGTATVYAVWKMAKTFFSESAARPAAFFLAVSFIHVRNSHYLYADIPMAFFVTVFFYRIFCFFRSYAWKDAVLAGVFLGLAVGTKYNAAIVVIPVLVGFFVRPRPPAVFYRVLLLLFCAAAVFFLTNPFVLLDWGGFWETWRTQIRSQVFVGAAYHFFYSLANGLGWPLLMAACGGLVSLAFSRKREAWVLLLWVVLHYGVCIYRGQPYDRYMVPIVPFLCLAAGFGLWRLSEALKPRFGKAGFLCLPLFVVLFSLVPLSASAYGDYLMLRTDTRTLCRNWMEKRLPIGARIALDHPFFSPPLRQAPEQIEETIRALETEGQEVKARRLRLLQKTLDGEKTYWVYHLRMDADEHPSFSLARLVVSPDVHELAARGICYVVFNFQDAGPAVRGLYQRVKEEGRLLASFSPYRDPGRKWTRDPAALTADPIKLNEVFSRKRLGPYLEVYELKC